MIKHKTIGLTRPCNAHDLILTSNGLQCANCLTMDNNKYIKYDLNREKDNRKEN